MSYRFLTRLVIPSSKVEPELFPCLRKYGISFYEFNPRKHSLYDKAGSSYIVLQLAVGSSQVDTTRSTKTSNPGHALTPQRGKDE